MKRFYTGYLVIAIWAATTLGALAQQKIGSNLGTLNPGAVLELESTNRGFLPSRVALTASNVWSLNGTATNGMMVYNTATVTGGNALTPGYYMWQDGSWVRIVTGVISTTNALTYTPGTQTLTSTVNGQAANVVLPTASPTTTGLLTSADYVTFNGKENVLTFANGLTRTANAITLGGALNQNTALTLAANNFTFGGATTGKVIVSGPAGSTTSGLQLSNLLTAVTPNAAVASQRVLTVDANGNVILGTDFGTNNAGTVTNVTGTGLISVANGTTTPAISLTPGTNGQYLSTVGGVPTWAALPTVAVTGAANGNSLVAGNVEMGGALTKATTVTLGTNALTYDASGTGQFIVSGPVGNTAGLRLSNLTGAGTAGTVGQKVLSVNASGDVVLVTDFGTNNAGTVTNVSGTAPINVATGTTTPVISINALGITTGLLADNAVTTPKIADAAVTAAKIAPGTNGQYLTTVGGVTTWAALPTPAVTGATNGTSLVAGNVELGGALTKPTTITTTATNTLSLAGLTAKTVQVDNNDSLLVVNAQGRVQYLAVSNLPANNIYNADGSLTGNRTATLGANNLTFNASSTGQVIVSGPVGNTAGLRLSNLTGAGTAGTVGQKVLSVNASGDVVLVTDFGTNNAGTVTNVTGTAPINVATGTTTPVISINALGITTGLLADNAVTTPKIADGAITAAKLNPMGATAGQVLTWNGTAWAPTTSTFNNIYTVDGTLTGNRVVTQGASTLTFTGTGNTLLNSGNVGIGTATPTQKLTINGGAGPVGLNIVNGSGEFRVGVSAGGINYGVSAGNVMIQNRTDNGLAFGTNGDNVRMYINNIGNVGIGTTLPNAPLQFANAEANRKIVLWDSFNNNHQFYGFGVNTDILRYQVSRTGARHAFYAGTSDSTSTEIMTVNGNGNVGIGTSTPTSTLQVNGSMANAILRITAATTLNQTHHTIIANAFTAGYAITLPAPSTCSGRVYVIRKVDESSNAITFTFTGITGSNAIRVSDTSATVGSYINSLNYTKTLRIQSDGTDWYLID